MDGFGVVIPHIKVFRSILDCLALCNERDQFLAGTVADQLVLVDHLNYCSCSFIFAKELNL
jgi:hypothetical protein